MTKNEGCAGCKASIPPKWRQDFPIEWEGDHYVSRREMVKFLTLGSLLLAVGELGDGAGQQVPAPRVSRRALHRLCRSA